MADAPAPDDSAAQLGKQLFDAVAANDEAAARAARTVGADPDSWVEGEHKFTALYAAADLGRLPLVVLLLQWGADINKPNVRAQILLPAHPLA